MVAISLVICLAALMLGVNAQSPYTNCTATTGDIYGYSVTSLDGTTNITLDSYRNKVLLIVNTASFCGYTPQYLELNQLIIYYRPDFEVLAFPTNQFGLLEPGTNEEVLNCLAFVRPGGGYAPNFPLTQKQQVNGANEHPLFTFLKSACPGTQLQIASHSWINWDPVRQTDITNNFEKFLIGVDGKPMGRYHPAVAPNDLRLHIEYGLSKLPRGGEKILPKAN